MQVQRRQNFPSHLVMAGTVDKNARPEADLTNSAPIDTIKSGAGIIGSGNECFRKLFGI
jgi:hypothetical protein